MANNLFFEVNGVKFEGFIKGSLTQTLENFVDIFSFTFSVKETIANQRRVPQDLIKVQDTIRIFIDNELLSTGFVDKLLISFDDETHDLSVIGRSITADLIDSDIDGRTYNNIIDFQSLVTRVLSDNGYNNIKVINGLGALPINLKGDTSGAWGRGEEKESDTSEKIFTFLDKYALEAKVLLRTNKDGNIVLTREETEQTIGSITTTKNNLNNNVKSARIIIDNSDRFRFNEIRSEEDNSSTGWTAVSQAPSIFEDKLVRSPRRIRNRVKFTSNQADLNDIVKWETNLRRAKSINYSCLVQGFYNNRQNTDLWQPNKLVAVLDDKCQLDGQFLIKGVTYNKDLENGTTTRLDIVNRGTFNLDPDKVTKDLESNDFGTGLINIDV